MIKQSILGLLLLIGVSSANSASATEALQEKLNAIRTLSANFKQVIKAKARTVSSSSGTMALERPGKFRWQTIKPMAQLVIADSNKLWVYDVDLEQVTVKKQEQGVGGTAGLFLSGYNDTVARDFSVTERQAAKETVYDLQAKSHQANFQQVKLAFLGAALTRMELYDQLGQKTTVLLSQVKVNPTLPAKLFRFKVPKGVDVVKQ